MFMYKKSKTDTEILNHQKPKIELRSKNKVKFKQIFTDKTEVQNSPLLGKTTKFITAGCSQNAAAFKSNV